MRDDTDTAEAPETDWSRALRIPRAGLPVALLHEQPRLAGLGIAAQLDEWART